MEDSHFQVIILGTGLTESVTAAALAKAGLKVAHIDCNQYYGADEASLSLNELKQCISAAGGERNFNTRLSSASLHGDLPSSSRDYSVSLSPSIIPSVGPLITTLIQSGVARYGGFKLVESISVYSAEGFKNVPGSKEDIFKSKELSLMDKRRLMRFLTFAAGEFEASTEIQGNESIPFVSFLQEVFSLNKQLASVLAYALAFCKDEADLALPALQRIRRHLRSAGRYGPSPFLVGQYGGLGELAQGFCRVCAVSGGTYILGRGILSLEAKKSAPSDTEEVGKFHLRLSDMAEDLTADVIVSSVHFLPHLNVAHESGYMGGPVEETQAYCIALIDASISRPSPSGPTLSANESKEDSDARDQSRPIDAALLVFLPGELQSGKASGPVNVFINGEGTLSCPRGKSILYLSTPIQSSSTSGEAPTPELLLRPYLEATLSLLRSLDGSPLKEVSVAFYTKSTHSALQTRQASLKEKGILVSPTLPDHLAEVGDAAAVNGEALFRDVLKCLGRSDADGVDFWPPMPQGFDDDDEDML